MNQVMARCIYSPYWDNLMLCAQNTMVLTGLHSYHNDPEVWGDPHVYRPERFLDEKGQLLKKDLTLPFGAG
jgi:cytochrome P450